MRTGRKGSGEFRRATRDEALGAIKMRWSAIIDQHGPAAILPYSYLGPEGLLNGLNAGDAFFNRLGATISERTFCDSDALSSPPHASTARSIGCATPPTAQPRRVCEGRPT